MNSESQNYSYEMDDLSTDLNLKLPDVTTGSEKENAILKLTYGLQATLDIGEIVRLFAIGIQDHIPFDGINYGHDEAKINVNVGIEQINSYSCNLLLDNDNLGKVKFSRTTRFTNKEILQLENLLCIVMYPLRNAIKYRSAVHSAMRDALTGAGNRAAFNEDIHRVTEIAKRYDSSFTLLALDIDHFKKINDNFGHSAGDCVLANIATVISQSIRDTDTLYRTGGEEFAVILTGTDSEGAQMLAERIRLHIASLVCRCEGHRIRSSASIGIATYKAGDSESSLYERADEALYAVKKSGRNGVKAA